MRVREGLFCRRNTKEVTPSHPGKKSNGNKHSIENSRILKIGSIIRFHKKYSKEGIFIELTLPKA